MGVFQEHQFTFHHYLTSLTGWLRMVSVIAKGHIGYAASDLLFFVILVCKAGLVVPFYLSWFIGFILILTG